MLWGHWLKSISASSSQQRRGGRQYATSCEVLETRQLLTLLTTDQTSFVSVVDPALTLGPQSHLVIRINLQDKLLSADGTFTDAEIRATMQQVSAFHERQTFGQVTFPDNQLDIVPGTLTIPYTQAQIEDGSTPGAPSSAPSGLHDPARAMAAALG